LAAIFIGLGIWIGPSVAHSGTTDPGSNEIRIAALQGTVEIAPVGATTWVLTQTNQILHPADKLRTGPNSRVTIRWSDQSVVTFGALTVMEILPPDQPGTGNGLNLFKGLLSFFHRDPPGRIRVITRGGSAGVKGTEFVMAVETNGTDRTTLSVIDGKVELSNEQGTRVVRNNQQAVAVSGQEPVLTPGFAAKNVLQWCLYYPAVLDLRELPLAAEEEQALGESLAAYRSGDLLAALTRYPDGRQPGSDAERVYYAALLLSVGQVTNTEFALATLPAADPSERLQRLATALRQLIAAVKREPNPSTLSPQLSTELLAASYYEQSRAVGDESLKAALNLAWQAATNSPEFGFAWERVAELEFSFGHTGRALEALNKSLELSPRNAQALALKGFLLAAENKTREAIDWFDQAIAVDSALGNAWLGRGLCRIRRGDTRGGREELLIAAALEPQRSLLRS
jgi:tetratricopeptide (TPR) repeat protein